METKIAVIIPLFNKAPYIAKALDSILAQTFAPAEIIVVDDGSRDEGAGIVQCYTGRGVTLIKQENQGVSAARNAGIRAARADYVAFLDADDLWHPHHLLTLHQLIFRFPDAGLLSTSHVIHRDGKVFRPSSTFADGWVGQVPDFFTAYRKGLSLVNSSTACCKRSALLSVGGFPVGVKRGEDIIVWIRLALAFSVAHAEVVTAIYNQSASFRSNLLKEVEPPDSLKYLSKLLNDVTLEKQNRRSIGLLFDWISVCTAAGFQINGDRVGVYSILRLAVISARYSCVLKVAAIGCLPSQMLCIVRGLRHRRVRSGMGVRSS